MRMQKLGADVTGLDFSEESIKIAKERNPNIQFVIDDMLNDYSYLGKFDGCAVIAGLVHLPNWSSLLFQKNRRAFLSAPSFMLIISFWYFLWLLKH